MFLICSLGGCGKTHLNQGLMNRIRSQCAIALDMAASVIAAFLLEGGATFHSSCKLARDIATGQPCGVTPNNDRGRIFLATRFILIDVIYILHRDNLEALDKAQRDLTAYKVHLDLAHVLFGEKVVVLSQISFKSSQWSETTTKMLPCALSSFAVLSCKVSVPLPWRKACVFVRRTTRTRIPPSSDGLQTSSSR